MPSDPGVRQLPRACLVALMLTAVALPSCSLKTMAVKTVANTLSKTGDVFTRDDDPTLVGDALPFALKLYESLLESVPNHVPLLVSTCGGFTQYSYAFVEAEANTLDSSKHDEARELGDRALKLYLRGRGYCLRAIDARFGAGTRDALLRDPTTALAKARVGDVPLLYWTAASWGSAISLGIDQGNLQILDRHLIVTHMTRRAQTQIGVTRRCTGTTRTRGAVTIGLAVRLVGLAMRHARLTLAIARHGGNRRAVLTRPSDVVLRDARDRDTPRPGRGIHARYVGPGSLRGCRHFRRGDFDADRGEHRMSDSLRRRGQSPRERQAARTDQHRADPHTDELQAQRPPSRRPPGHGRLGGAGTDPLLHRQDRRPLTRVIEGEGSRARSEEPGHPGVTGRCVVGRHRPREESIRGSEI